MSRASAIAAAVAGLAVFAAPAGASEVVHVKLGSTIEQLIVGPDGGAWVEIYGPNGVAIGRAPPGGGFRTSGIEYSSVGRTLGPDGQAWFKLGSRDYVRADGAGNLTTVGPLPDGPALGHTIATGPDGTLWNLTATGGRFAHVTPQGTVTYSATRVPKCDRSIPMGMERAADGAIWINDQGCERLIRVTATEARVVVVKGGAEAIAADASGGVWFAATPPTGDVGHVDAAGTLKRYPLDRADATDVAVAADGSAWFALRFCALARVSPAGDVTTAPAPIPTQQLGFDLAGGMWFASKTRLVHVVPGEASGPCDDHAPTARITPGRDGGTISLKALRRGLRITISEPAVVEATGYPYRDAAQHALPDIPVVKRVMAKAGSLRYRLPASTLRQIARRLAAGDRPGLGMYVSVTNAEGMQNVIQSALRVKR